MRNKDVVQVTNSVSTEATKFVNYIRTINSSLNDPINSALSVYALKNVIKTGTPTSTAIFTGSAPIINAPTP